jgi:hypothetical protein
MKKLKYIYFISAFVVALLSSLLAMRNAEAFFVYEKYPLSSDAQFSSVANAPQPSVTSATQSPKQEQWLVEKNAVAFYGKNAVSQITFGKRTWSDCLVTINLDIDQGDEAGVLLHYQHERNHYKVILNRRAHTVSVEKVFEGNVTILDTVAIDYMRYQNKVSIDFYKDEIAVFVNSRSTILVKDNSIPYGMAGFFVKNADHVVFSDARVEYKVSRDSVLNHLTDVVTSVGSSLEFPVLMDKVRIGEVMLQALEIPQGAVFSNGSFTWNPSEAQMGDCKVVFKAESRDGIEQERKEINVTVFKTIAEAEAFHRIGTSMVEDDAAISDEGTVKKQAVARSENKSETKTKTETGDSPDYQLSAATASPNPKGGNLDTSGLTNPVSIYGGSLPCVSRRSSETTPPPVDNDGSQGSGNTGGTVVPATPSIPVITLVVEGLITLNWSNSSASGATKYLLEQSFDDVAFFAPITYWVAGTTQQIKVTKSGTYYFRVSAYTKLPADGGKGSAPSNIVQVNITLSTPDQPTPPVQPTFLTPPVTDLDGAFTLHWSDESASGATTYLLEQSNEQTFVAPVKYWTALTEQAIQVEAGTYYFRVTAYTEPLPAGIASTPSQVISVNVVNNETILDVMATFLNVGTFNEYPQGSTTALTTANDPQASDGTAYKLHYDAREQNFTGMYFKDPALPVHDITKYKSIHYRFRTADEANGPFRIIIELKVNGEIKGNVLVSDITGQYQDLDFPLYCDGGLIDEITIVILKDSDPDKVGDIFVDALFFDEADYVPPTTPVVPAPAAKTMTDEQLLDKLESDMAHYFYYEVIGPGFVKNSVNSDFASISTTGFGLSALAILAERYDAANPLWNKVSPEQARARAYQIISHLLDVQENQRLLSDLYGKEGCFYHFIDKDGKRLDAVEVSTVDTAILVAGALTAGEYFGDEVKALADVLYANIDWTFFLNRATQQYHMGWKPEASRDYATYADGGFLSNARYNVYTDEILLIAILALGNHPLDADVAGSFYAFSRDKKAYTLKQGEAAGDVLELVPSYLGSMFTYIYGHCFFDFETLGEDKPQTVPGLSAMEPVDWWMNSRDAILANKDFCTDRSKYFPFSLDNGNSWGFSACELPSGRYEGLFGAPPLMNGPGHDGTVAVTMPICALPFLRTGEAESLSDNPAFNTIDYYYRHYTNELYGKYGFYGSYNNKGEFNKNYLGIDVGAALLMIENYRSRAIWETLILNEKITGALNKLFSEGFDYVDLEVKDIVDDSNSSGLDFGENPDGTDIAVAAQYLQVNFTFSQANRGLAIFTDNQNNPLHPYTGSGNAAGMVGYANSTQVVPLYWLVFDDKQADSFDFPLNGNVGIIQDKSMVGFYEYDAIMDRTIVDGLGNLAPYPTAARVAADSTVYVYYGADFRNAEAQTYGTETLTVDAYQYN